MKYGVLGTGMVGQTLATKLAELGHDVMMGSRTAGNEKAKAWQAKAGPNARIGTFRDTAKFAQMLLSCTEGLTSIDALASADSADLEAKVVIDVSNPLDTSKGWPALLSICNDDSLGETLQRRFPAAHIVKALNTCNCEVMVDPAKVNGEHELFICGNDAPAKEKVKGMLREFGWTAIIDLGDITNARGTEQLMPIWMRLYELFGTPLFNFHLAR